MSSRQGPRAFGTDGSDFQHRERVAAHYAISAKYKTRLKYNILASVLLCLAVVAKEVAEELFQGSANNGLINPWEVFWLCSILPSIIGMMSLPKNKASYLTVYIIGIMPFGIGGVIWGVIHNCKDIHGYVKGTTTSETLLYLPGSLILFTIFGICLLLYGVGLYHANILLSAWNAKGNKRQ